MLEGALGHHAEDIARPDLLARPAPRREGPSPLRVESGRLEPGRQGPGARRGERGEGALQTVERGAEQPWSEPGAERRAGRLHRVADAEAGRLLVDLDGGRVGLEVDHLAEQARGPDADDLPDDEPGQPCGPDDRSGGGHDPAARLRGRRGGGRAHGPPPPSWIR